MMKLKIEAWGDTDGDLDLAIEQVQASIARGNTSGMDRNETGGYSFEISEDTPAPRFVIEGEAPAFRIRNTETGLLVLDGIMPLMPSTRAAAEREVEHLTQLHTEGTR